jgi:hypothetical protein
MSDLPLVPGPLYGLRKWTVVGGAGSERLAGPHSAVGWPVEASGPIEVHVDGFRARRARPHAFVLAPGRNPALVRRLAAAYRAPVIEAGDPEALLAWCRARGLGLEEQVVRELLGRTAEQDQQARVRRTWAAGLRTAAALAAVVLLLLLGLIATDSPGDRTLFGRTGEIHGHR